MSKVLALVLIISAYSAMSFNLTPRGRLAGIKTVTQSPLRRGSKHISLGPLFADNDDWEAPKSAMVGGAGVNNAGEPPFEIRGFSLGNAVLGGGLLLTTLGFVDYLSNSGGIASAAGFVYGIPIALGGCALKYAEIEPVPCITANDAQGLFEKCQTETISKIKQDVTRHRYGDEAHLDTTVKRLGLVIPGKAYPQLKELREENTDGELSFSMVFQSLDTPYKMWADPARVKKYETFFGPGVSAECVKIDADQRMVAIKLTTGEKKEAPPAAAAAPESVEATEVS
ncbi:hypothetical protein TrST_g6040 [Triparma strigata]|uniref:Uncharacterized protein n=1 Tax=Triparma strigata TaxID=1606541 RepID=A0A9W7B564_9STRA|nr:hypothetical protein TrST_g6040 [Triparma strigata]